MFFLALVAFLLPAAGASADCTSEVNDAFAKLRGSAAFRMETKITNEQGTLTMSNDYVLPDRMHQRVSLSTGGPGTMEMILIGDHAWSNQGNGWAPLPPEFVAKIAKQMKETVVEPPKDESQYACLGDVTFEGKTYAAFSTKRAPAKAGTAPGAAAQPASDTPNVQTVYIDKATGLPARNIVASEKEPAKRLFDGTFTLRDGLKIEAPKL
jgi:hypothetical protein